MRSIANKDKVSAVTLSADNPEHVSGSDNVLGRMVLFPRSFAYKLISSNQKIFKATLVTAAAILYNVYLTAVIHAAKGETIDWCDGAGFLYILTAITYWGIFYYFVLKRCCKNHFFCLLPSIEKVTGAVASSPSIVTALCVAAVSAYLLYDTWLDRQRLMSVGGILVIIAMGLLISKHPGRVKWRSVALGICLQLVLGLVMLRWPAGRDGSMCLSGKVKTFLDFTDAGTEFVYGYLATGFNQTLGTGDVINLPPLLAFKPLSVIFFFNFVMGFLHHYGILMWVIQKVGWFLEIIIGTAAVESTASAANIFLGQSEVFLLNKPFLPHMTKSELTALMAAGLATVAGAEYGLLMSFGISASYLISASVMAAPASLALSKLIYPETEKSVSTAANMKALQSRVTCSALDAAARGATEGVVLIGTIIANLVAFIATVTFVNAILLWLGNMVGVALSFEMILGKIFIPFAYLMGVQSSEVEDVAILLGLKTIVNEVVAYRKMVSPEMAHLSVRTKVIATHALCSFANIGSVGIQLGAISYIAPERRKDIIKTVWFAFIIGSLCGVLNACVAGALTAA